MSTMLEKAARALCRRDILKLPQFKEVGAEAATDDAVNTGWPEYVEDARAALQAIRGMDGHGIELNYWSERVVDAILSEEA